MMTHEEARERVEKIAADMVAVIQQQCGYTPDAYWIDRNRFVIVNPLGEPIANLYAETVQ